MKQQTFILTMRSTLQVFFFFSPNNKSWEMVPRPSSGTQRHVIQITMKNKRKESGKQNNNKWSDNFTRQLNEHVYTFFFGKDILSSVLTAKEMRTGLWLRLVARNSLCCKYGGRCGPCPRSSSHNFWWCGTVPYPDRPLFAQTSAPLTPVSWVGCGVWGIGYGHVTYNSQFV